MSKIQITYNDLSDPEKGETFRDLFGETKFHQVKKKMAEKVHGGKRYAELQQIVKSGTDEDYEKIRDTLMDEMDALVAVKDAYADIEIGSATREALMHSKRSAAKKYLGESRYGEAIGYPQGSGYINSDTLFGAHPHAESNADRKQRFADLRKEKRQQEQQQRNDKIERLTGGENGK